MDKLSLKNKSITDVLRENTDIILPIVFYLCGLIIGSYFFKKLQNTFLSEVMKDIFLVEKTSFESMIINNFCLYFSIFAVTVILGMCLIGFPFLNIIPLAMGIEIGLKISYYYVNYSTKGIGYALLMIIPQVSALVTIIGFTIKKSITLSKSIYSLTANKTDIAEEINLKLYLKSFVIYSLIIALTAVINTLLHYLLGSIISI